MVGYSGRWDQAGKGTGSGIREKTNDGFVDANWNGSILRNLNWIYARMRAFEVMAMHIETAIILFISVALFVYLIYALLRPEKF